MARAQRLRRARDFREVLKCGARFSGPLFVVVARGGQGGATRMGLSVSRRVGGAVERNRAKRRLREAWRQSGAAATSGLRVVIVAKPAIAGTDLHEITRECQRAVRQLQRMEKRVRRGHDGALDAGDAH